MKAGGFGTIEAIVATALFSLVAAGVASTLVLARRLQTDAARERYATQLAIAAMERLRAGQSAVPSAATPGFIVTGDLTPSETNPGVLEAYVRVARQDGHARALELRSVFAR